MRTPRCDDDDDDVRCRCEQGCACALTCWSAKDCKPSCRGAGTTCTVVATGPQIKASCEDGATCRVQGLAPAGEITVDCRAATCELACAAARSCNLECKDGSRCLLRCEASDKCEMKNCNGPMQECAGGVRVCGRPCP